MSEKSVRAGGLLVGLLLAFLVAFMSPVTARADGQPTQLEVEVSAWVDGSVEVAGRLLDSGGSGVPGAHIAVSVAGSPVGSGSTDGDGSFRVSFAMPTQFRTGTPQVDISYAGDGTYAASGDARRVDYGGQQLGLAGNPGAEVAKVGEAQQSVVTLNFAEGEASPGDTVRLNGTLSTAHGDAIANGVIKFALNGQQQPDLTVVSGESGAFESFVQIPVDAAPGAYTVTASFEGSQQLQATSAEASISVVATASTAQAESESAQPSESVETLGSPTPAPGAATSAPQNSEASAAPTAVTGGTTPTAVTWVIIGGIVLASGTGLALIVMALRPRRRPDPDEEGGLIGDPEDPEVELLGEGEGWEGMPAGAEPAQSGITEVAVVPLDQSASAFAPPVTVRAMPRHGYREPVDPAPTRGLVEDTQPPSGDSVTEEVRGPAVPRRAAP